MAVYASFEGSESYWPSHAIASFAVDSATQATTAPIVTTQSVADQYFLPAVAAIILAIAIGFAITILILRKKP